MKILSNKILYLAYTTVILTTFLSEVYAQNAPLKFENISKKEGLNQSAILSVAQDNDGFIWFSSYGGLIRYDGYTFKDYITDENDSHSIPSNTVEIVYVDKSGTLWAGSNNGLAKYDKLNDRFNTYKNDPADRNTLGYNKIRTLFEDRNNNLWIGTYGGGLNLFLQDSNKFLRFIHNQENEDGITNNYVSVIFEDSEGMLWIGTDGGLNKLDPKTFQFSAFQHNPNKKASISSNNVISIAEDEKGYLWVGTWGEGLNRYDKSSRKFKRYKHNANISTTIAGDIVKSLLFDKNGNFWIGTYGGGLDLFDYKTNTFIHHKTSYSNKNSISDNVITNLFEDNTGNIWIGTQYSGASQIDFYKNQFEHYTVDLENEISLSHKNVSSICENKNGDIWIGTLGGGLNKFDSYQNRFIHYLHDANDSRTVRSNMVRTIFSDSKNILWVATQKGLDSYESDKETFIHHKIGSNGKSINNKDVFDIYEDKNNDLWFATWNGGLNKYSRKSKKFTYYLNNPDDESSISSNQVISIYEDRLNHLWMGTDFAGLNLFDRETEKFTRFYHDANDSTTISNDKVLCFAEDSNNNLWIGTARGLNLFDRKTKSFSRVKVIPKFEHSTIMEIIVDGEVLWISTSHGLIYYNVSDQTTYVYYKDNGLQENEFSMRAGLRSTDGKLYFGGINGLSAFYPNNINNNLRVPPVVLTELSVGAQIIKPNQEYNNNIILDTIFTYSKEITLLHNQNYFTIEFSALNYNTSSKNAYIYFLDGYDEEYTYIENRRPAYYTNVDPGEYIFRIKGSNNHGTWGNDFTELKIIILPPFWDTYWFRLILLLIIIIGIYLIFRARIRRIKMYNLKLEKEVERQTRELQKSNEILEREVEIRVAADAKIISNLKELQKSKLEIANRAEELTNLNNKLSDSEKALKSLNASKDKFFSIIAHDLRNPFTTLLGYTNLLKDEYDSFSKEEVLDSIDAINRMAQVVFNLLDNLLKWSSIHTGRMVFNPENIRICKMVALILQLLEDTANKKKIKLDHKLNPDAIVYADKLMIETVIRNLISNAIKFTPSGGTICVNSEIVNDTVELKVIDNGIGISDEDIDKLFRIDVHHSTDGTASESGSGLGLILCKELIEKNNGSIKVKSRLNEGSQFIVTLPISKK